MSTRIGSLALFLGAAIVLASIQPTPAKTIRCSVKMGCRHTHTSNTPIAGKHCTPSSHRGWRYDRSASGINKSGIKHKSFYRCTVLARLHQPAG